jgi:hypothetical protein
LDPNHQEQSDDNKDADEKMKFDCLSNSVALQRARKLANRVEMVRKSFSEMRGSNIDREAWFWAVAIVRSRCFTYCVTAAGGAKGETLICAICPWIDLANHRSNNG